MNLLSRLLGRRPKLAPGATLFVDHAVDRYGGSTYVVRMVPPGGVAGPHCEAVSPTFTSDEEASRYRDWCEGGPAYRYPTGKA